MQDTEIMHVIYLLLSGNPDVELYSPDKDTQELIDIVETTGGLP